MKLLALGDVHLMSRTPSSRVDDIVETEFGKLQFVLDMAVQRGCWAVLQPGDLFDQPRVSYQILRRCINMLKASGRSMLGVLGQHDVSFHSVETFGKAAVGVMEAAEFWVLLSDKPYSLPDGVSIYGAHYGQQVPEPVNAEAFNILVVHASIGSQPLFPGHDLTLPEDFLRRHPKYGLVICGDYHYSFDVELGKRRIINAGCLLRKTASLRDLEHVPKVAIVSCGKEMELEIEWIAVKHLPVEEVFKSDVLENREGGGEDKKALGNLIGKLRSGISVRSSFKDSLLAYFIGNGTDSEVRQAIMEELERRGL